MKRLTIVACVTTLAAILTAVPAKAAAPVDVCTYGRQCFYDDSYGNDLLFTAARCGEHDLRGGVYQNRINFVDNNSTAHVYLDIWRNAGYWELYAHVGPWGLERIWTNDIDRIRITC